MLLIWGFKNKPLFKGGGSRSFFFINLNNLFLTLVLRVLSLRNYLIKIVVDSVFDSCIGYCVL